MSQFENPKKAWNQSEELCTARFEYDRSVLSNQTAGVDVEAPRKTPSEDPACLEFAQSDPEGYSRLLKSERGKYEAILANQLLANGAQHKEQPSGSPTPEQSASQPGINQTSEANRIASALSVQVRSLNSAELEKMHSATGQFANAVSTFADIEGYSKYQNPVFDHTVSATERKRQEVLHQIDYLRDVAEQTGAAGNATVSSGAINMLRTLQTILPKVEMRET